MADAKQSDCSREVEEVLDKARYGDLLKLNLEFIVPMGGCINHYLQATELAVGFYRATKEGKLLLGPSQIDAYIFRYEDEIGEPVVETWRNYDIEHIASLQILEIYQPKCDNSLDNHLMEMLPADLSPGSAKVRDMKCVCGDELCEYS